MKFDKSTFNKRKEELLELILTNEDPESHEVVNALEELKEIEILVNKLSKAFYTSLISRYIVDIIVIIFTLLGLQGIFKPLEIYNFGQFVAYIGIIILFRIFTHVLAFITRQPRVFFITQILFEILFMVLIVITPSLFTGLQADTKAIIETAIIANIFRRIIEHFINKKIDEGIYEKIFKQENN